MDAQALKKKAIRLVFGLAFTGAAGTALYTYGSLHFTYSSGQRVGFVQKLSTKGWLCKTNEGELAMVSIPGQPAQIFQFTVPDAEVVKKIDALAGHKVALSYEEHKGIPSTCFGDTLYFVTDARKAD